MRRLLFILTICFLSLPIGVRAADYYVDAGCGTPGNGTSSACVGAGTDPFQTIAAAQAAVVGDQSDNSLLFNKGDTWREQFTLGMNGTADHSFTVGAYGTGDMPIIKGSDIASGFVDHADPIWKKAGVTTEPHMVFFDGTYGDHTPVSIGTIVDEFDWFWESDILYVYSATDPDDEYTTIEMSQRDYCILIQEDYITVDGIDVQHANDAPGALSFNGAASTGGLVQNCAASYNWGVGFRAGDSTALVTAGRFTNNTAHHNVDGGIIINKNGTNWQIDRNTIYQNNWVEELTSIRNKNTCGIKVWADNNAGFCSGITIEHNKVYSNGFSGGGVAESVGIWFDQILTPSTRNIVRYNEVYGNFGIGIFVEKADNTDVYANLVYGNAQNSSWLGGIPLDSAGLALMSNNTTETADNNAFYDNTIYGGLIGILSVAGVNGTPELNNNTFKDNIVLGTTNESLYCSTGGANNTTNGTGNVYESNCFGVESVDFIFWDANGDAVEDATEKEDTYDDFIAASSQTDNNVELDPLFTNAGADDFTLQPNSPARHGAAHLVGYEAKWRPESPLPPNTVTTMIDILSIGAYGVYRGSAGM